MKSHYVVQLKNPKDGCTNFLCSCNDEFVAQIIKIALSKTILAQNADIEVSTIISEDSQ